MPLDNKISNIIGVQLPQWVKNQLKTRSEQNSQDFRDNRNLLYLSNKTAWIRLVSSVNIKTQKDIEHFKGLGAEISDETSLAKNYVLFGGTSKYLNENGKPSYQLRSGLNGSYGMLGTNEIQKYGYRPMPGITSVNIETQGRLGSIRQATVNFKCWDKSQLDIIDILYFKMGFTMFLEWGHTYFYPSANPIGNEQKLDPNKLYSTELYSLDPFEQSLTKEEILKRIAKNCRDTEGNYDAMLGMVTNFNFSYNQEGGFDCSLKMIGLGVLGESIKINNTGNLPNVLEEQIKQYNNILEQIERAKNGQNQPDVASSDVKDLNLKETLDNIPVPQRNYSYDSKTPEKTELANATIQTDLYGQLFVLKRLNGLIPLKEDLLSNVNVKLDNLEIYSIFSEAKKTLNSDSNWKGNTSTINSKGVFESIIDSFESLFSPQAGFEDLIKSSGYIIEQKYKNSSINKFTYSISIERNAFAKTDTAEAVNQYYPIKLNEFYENFGAYIYSNSIKIKKADVLDLGLDGKYGIRLRFEFTIPFTKKVQVKVGETVRPDKSGKDPIYETKDVQYNLPVFITTDDTALIKSFLAPDVTQPVDFLSEEKLREQDQQKQATQDQQAPPQNPSSAATESPLKSLSNLELVLRTIQVHSLVKSIRDSNNDLSIGKQVVPVELSKDRNFIEQIFSSGVFSDFIGQLISGSIKDEDYDTQNKLSEKDTLQIQAKYGFVTSLMANREKLYELTDAPAYYGDVGKVLNRNFDPVDFNALLTSYVVPYNIDQTIEEGTTLNHPVYIPFGQLLMLLNDNSIIYDTSQKSRVVKPLVYIDFNPNHNYCLSNAKQLSTDPFTALIPFEGSDLDYASLFDSNVLLKAQEENKISGYFIAPLSGSNLVTPLFEPRNGVQNNFDVLSAKIPSFRYDSKQTSYNPYRGKIMNILLNIDYVMQIIKKYSVQDGEGKVYMKPFIEQILTDINKSLGNFNVFRLSYNDQGNVFQIVDDQIIPTDQREKRLNTTTIDSDLPLFGKNSIAKSLEIKSEVSSKLANMIAISANADVGSKATLSTDGTSFGYINFDLEDRYVPNRGPANTGSINNDSLKNAAIQFNSAITKFYSSIDPSKDQVGFATNYYIEKMNSIKGTDSASVAANSIPVSVNFTTDGISGVSMGQAFTVPKELLPYVYGSRANKDGNDQINKIGFAIAGLSHTIDNNSWNTAVRAIMVFLKDESVFANQSTQTLKSGQFTAPSEGESDESLNVSNFANYSAVSSSYSNIKFSNIGYGNPAADKINPTLLGDINFAAQRAGVTVTITTAVSGHKVKTSSGRTSRHAYGNAVDIAIIDGIPVNDKTKAQAKVNAFINQLNGYRKNTDESGNPKIVLSYGYPNHEDHIHVSYNPNIA